jgi:hypothetical protein
MKCEHCGKKIEKPIQEDKLDYWKCSCGDYHLGFPYICPRKIIGEFERLIKLNKQRVVETSGKEVNTPEKEVDKNDV